jgi:multidrug efflux pump subunit AcrA (membrane-fusion protein)
VDGETARQRRVETGVRTDGEVEVLHGLAGGERVVVDGAGFLTDGARISVRPGR